MADMPVMLITGGSGSIGSEITVQAAAVGWRVAIQGRTETKVAEVVARAGDDATGFPRSLDTPEAITALVADVAAHFGRIDAVIDCVSTAPRGITGPFAGTDPQAYAALYEASIVHLQKLAHAALPWLAKQGGTLIAFASDAGKYAAPRQTMIGASRAAIMVFVRNLAMEVARDKVRVHCISPSYVEGSASLIRAEAHAAGRMDKARARAGLGLPTAADIAPLALFLCGEGAAKMTGQVLSINGGLNA